MRACYIYIYIYKLHIISIYIYIYIIIPRQTVSLYYNSSVWLDTEDAPSWDGNPPNFTLDLVSYLSSHIYIYDGLRGIYIYIYIYNKQIKVIYILYIYISIL